LSPKLILLLIFLFPFHIHGQEGQRISQEQAQFIRAISLLNEDPEQAIDLLEELYANEQTIRIELEIARAYFSLGEYEIARAKFIAILDKELPISVRNNVEIFLSRIQERQSPFEFNINAVYDSNPMAVTTTNSVRLFGLDFDYTPQFEKRDEWGLQSIISFRKTLSPRIISGINFDFTKYEIDGHQRSYLSPYLSLNGFGSSNLNFGVSGIFDTYAGESLRNAIRLNTIYNLGIKFGSRISLFGSTEYSNYDEYDYLNGELSTLGVQSQRRLTENVTMLFSYSIKNSQAISSAYSYRGEEYRLGITRTNLFKNLEIKIEFNKDIRDYEGLQPFFGIYRNDKTDSISASITKRDFYFFGLRPVLNFTKLQNNSSVNIMNFDRDFVSLQFLKVY